MARSPETTGREAAGDPPILLIHFGGDDDVERRSTTLREFGYRVVRAGRASGTGLRRLVDAERPAAAVIDLDRIPSEGQAAALSLLTYRPTREVPIIFLDGTPDKVARVRGNVPEAAFVTSAGLRKALTRALGAKPRPAPRARRSVFDPYRDVSLQKKLGIKAGSVVALLHAPEHFEALLGVLPEGAVVRQDGRGRRDLTIWFVTRSAELHAGLVRLVPRLGAGGVWIAWPKKTSGLATDLTQQVVQEAGLANGLVDYKICSVDPTWSALRFSRRGGAVTG